MIRYRPFRNDDPPHLARIWREQPNHRGRLSAMSSVLFEQFVFSKLYFDRMGLIVAVDDGGVPIGFVHCGFGPNADRTWMDETVGVTSILMVNEHPDRTNIGAELLRHGEEYLKGRGAKTIHAVGSHDSNPFYLGLYGGSQICGVLASDQLQSTTFLNAGYVESKRYLVMQRTLAGFRTVTDRQTLQWRKQFALKTDPEPADDNWWDACVLGLTHRTQFALEDTQRRQATLSVTMWDMEPFASSMGVQARGIFPSRVAIPSEQLPLFGFLIGEVLRQLVTENVKLVEVQVAVGDEPTALAYRKLGFTDVDQGIVLAKSLDAANAV